MLVDAACAAAAAVVCEQGRIMTAGNGAPSWSGARCGPSWWKMGSDDSERGDCAESGCAWQCTSWHGHGVPV